MTDFNLRLALKVLLVAFPLVTLAQEDEKPVSKDAKRQRTFEEDYNPRQFDPESVNKPGRLKKLGFKAFELGDYYSAIAYFEKYATTKPEKWKVNYFLAESYRKTKNYEKAEEMYGKVKGAKEKKYPKSSFYLAQMMRQAGGADAEEVKSLMTNFTKIYKSGDAKIFKKLAKAEIAGADSTKAILAKNIKVAINPLPASINTPSMESTPIIVDDRDLIYGSINADVDEYYSIAGEDRPDRKLYLAKKSGPIKWESVGELPGPFNKAGFNVTSGAYSYDGLRFYFNRCPKDPRAKVKCTIWVSKFKNGEWLEPKMLPETVNMKETNSTQPAVGFKVEPKSGKKQDILYFVSDRPKGKGGLDIWLAPYDAKTDGFKKAKNAGKINTEGDEITPYYNSENSTLYYSSDGTPGLGGMDIFSAQGSDKFGKGTNVGSPLNTTADDVGFILNTEGSEGFFVSNRKGGNSTLNPTCCDDIYSFTYTDFIKLGLKGKVFEMVNAKDKVTSSNQLQGATLTLLTIDAEDNDTIPVNDGVETTKSGDFYVKLPYGKDYLLKIEKEFYDTRYIQVTTTDKTYSDTLFEDIGLKKTPPKEVYIPIVYFETNRAALTKQQKEEIKEILIPVLKQYPDMRLKIIGHSDDVGNDRFNVDLSQKRARIVYKFLADEGVEKERFEIYGLGSTKPLYKPGYQGLDTEFARSRNRRVNFEVNDPNRYKIIEKGVDQVLEKGEKFEE